MAVSDRLRPWQPRLLFLAVLTILVLVGVIQYQWFSRSAAVEIEGTIRGLEATVRQTALREFQRYAPLVSDLQDLGAGQTQSPVPTLDRLMKAYGPVGVTPDLLAWVGWGKAGATTIEVQGPEGHWTSRVVTGKQESRMLDKGSPFVGDLLTLGPGGKASQTIFFQTSGKQEVVILGIDQTKFWLTYVAPSLKEAFPGAEVSLVPSAPVEGPNQPRPGFDSRAYTFNPFTALASGPSVPRDIQVMLPQFFDPARGSRGQGSPEDSQVLLPPPGFVRVTVSLPPDAPVLSIEQRLAWNWLGGTLLLVVLALAFALVLGQSARVAALRRREREFMASVSHELRTPLTVIRSAADNFSQGIVAPARQSQYGKLILDQSLRLGRMVEQMLSFAQAEAAPPAPVQADLAFGPWLAELRPALEALAVERQVHLSWDVAGVPPSGLTDPEALRLVLENLVVNALNHAYPAPAPNLGPRAIRITLRHLVPDRLELTVDDDGRGIAAKETKKVFDPFYRDQVSRDNQEKGSGLGLFLAQKQARRLGGVLRLESPWRRLDGTKRPGCRFTLTVPFQPGNKEADHGR